MRIADWIVLIAGLAPYAPLLAAKAHKGYDNADPRNPAGYDTPGRRRLHALHLNSLEAFPFLAAAVLLAQLRGAAGGFVDGAALVWLALRALYAGCYISGRAGLRTLAWFAATLTATAIFLAGLLR